MRVGRVVQAIDDLGVMDNTLIIYITGDNGACANGGPNGRFNSLTSYNQIPETIADQLKHLDEFGGPHSDMTPPLGWAIADDTPFAYCAGYRVLWRQYEWRRYPLAKGDQSARRDSSAVPSPNRYRPDHPGGGWPAATQGRQWHAAETHRRCEHGLHLQGCSGKVTSHRAVYRGCRQSRHLQGRLVRRDPAQGAVGNSGHGLLPSTRTNGNSTTPRKTSVARSTLPRNIPTS